MSCRVRRSSSVTPSSSSRRATWVDTFDWTVNSAVAAAENEPLSTTARKERTWRRSIGHFLSGERMGEAGAGCGLVRPFDGDRRTLSSAVHSGRSRNCYSITKRDTSYRGYMLDKLREVFHNVVNAIAVLPPSTDDSKDLTPISPQSARSRRSWLSGQLLLSFCRTALQPQCR